MRVSAKAEYAVRAAIELAASGPAHIPSDVVADRQNIPVSFLHKIFKDLRVAGLIASQRGPEGGHKLARPAAEISIADILRAVEGPLADVHGTAPEALHYEGSAVPLQRVWVALRVNIRAVLEEVSLEDVARDKLPRKIEALGERPGAWVRTNALSR